MEFRLSAEAESLRQQVREFVRKEWRSTYESNTNSVYSYDVDEPQEETQLQEFVRKLAQKGWYTMHWPKEHGGRQVSYDVFMAYREEMAYQGAPKAVPGFEAHTLMLFGQPWMKDYFLPRIANGEIISFSQGYSEPNAGADLASLQTRAVQDGDDWVISGQKIWNSQAHHPWVKWGHYLVRTDPNAPKHRGISYFILDMNSPGVVIRPLFDALGRRRWSEVFLENVRVPSQNLIGELNRGWYAAMANMAFERANIEAPAQRLRDLERFIDYCQTTAVDGVRLADDPLVRHSLADARIRIETGRMFAYLAAWRESRGEVPVRESAFGKLFNDEMTPTVYETLARLLREYAVLTVGDRRAPLGGYPAVNSYLSWMNRFAGGGREIQSNIIAQRILGLPR